MQAATGVSAPPPPPPLPSGLTMATRPVYTPTQTWSNPLAAQSTDILNGNIYRIAQLQTQIEELNSANRKLAIQAAHNQYFEPELARLRTVEPELKRLKLQVDELNLQVINLKDRIKDGNREAEFRSNEFQKSTIDHRRDIEFLLQNAKLKSGS